MDRLVEAYQRARADGEPVPDAPALGSLLLGLYARGRAAHPTVNLEEAAFAEHLGRCGAAVEVGSDGAAVQAEDLYLCCAALLGTEAAVRELREAIRSVLSSYVGRIDSSRAFLDEIEQQIWDSLLVGTVDAPPKLKGYAGKGPLTRWLGVTAQRLALMQRRQEAGEERATARLGGDTEVLAADPELAFVKHTLRDQFRDALCRGLAVLPARERMIYRLYVVDGLSLDRIAKMYSVAQSTVSRWLANARKGILAEAKRVLYEEMRIAPEEYDSLARLLASEMDLSISRLLGEAQH
jgi:RNA polymerase sigma-70 factor (ECF subfamily)